MADEGPSPAGNAPDRLSEVSRLAGELADQILLESMIGTPSPAKVTALGEAAGLLEDCRHPVPDLVSDVLTRVHAREPDEFDGAGPEDGAPADGLDAPEAVSGRSRFIPRFMRSLRGSRA